jgi:hypothetical protein
VSITYTEHLPLQDRPKFAQIGIFGFENKPSGNPETDQRFCRFNHFLLGTAYSV